MIRMIVVGLALVFAAAGRAQAADLNVTVDGIRSDRGSLMIGLYDRADKFAAAVDNASAIGLLNDKERLVGVSMRVIPESESIGFLQLPPGRYAVVVFHDENDNGLLDTDLLGIPTEAYGFSNNATGSFGPPPFEAAAVTLSGADVSIVISLNY